MPNNKNVTDYHDFVTIDTPKEERRRLNVGDIYVNAATCNLCGDCIRSKNRHDFVECKCGNLFVDGGSWYVRHGFKKEKSFTNKTVMFSDVKEECSDSIEKSRKSLIKCSICGKSCDIKTAHLHQGKYIGDECCWDERLRSSE